jgi:hypothetical protein
VWGEDPFEMARAAKTAPQSDPAPDAIASAPEPAMLDTEAGAEADPVVVIEEHPEVAANDQPPSPAAGAASDPTDTAPLSARADHPT